MALFVGRLNSRIEKRDLLPVFARYGEITRCDISKNGGYAFVTYKDVRDAEDAIEALEVLCIHLFIYIKKYIFT